MPDLTALLQNEFYWLLDVAARYAPILGTVTLVLALSLVALLVTAAPPKRHAN